MPNPTSASAAATASAGVVLADYFDGRSARSHPVRVTIQGSQLHIEGDGLALDVPLRSVRWPERQRHGSQVVALAGAGSLHARPGQSWQALRDATIGESWVVRAQQSWRGVGLAFVALIAVMVAGWLWGVPLLARTALVFVPEDVDRYIGDQMATTMQTQWFGPTTLSAEDQQSIRHALAVAVNRTWPAGDGPAYDLRFVDGRKIGPNALALPGGTVFVTDQLVALARKPASDGADPQAMLVGVLGHELGHVERRHGMRSAAQAMLVGLVASVALGDISSLAASVPVMLVQSGYSRDFEREADNDSVRLLKAAGYSPAVMASFFERMAKGRGSKGQDESLIAISVNSHPPTTERIDYFREAGR